MQCGVSVTSQWHNQREQYCSAADGRSQWHTTEPPSTPFSCCCSACHPPAKPSSLPDIHSLALSGVGDSQGHGCFVLLCRICSLAEWSVGRAVQEDLRCCCAQNSLCCPFVVGAHCGRECEWFVMWHAPYSQTNRRTGFRAFFDLSLILSTAGAWKPHKPTQAARLPPKAPYQLNCLNEGAPDGHRTHPQVGGPNAPPARQRVLVSQPPHLR